MPNEPIHRASDRVRIELIEAGVDIAFGLVDDALEKFRNGNGEYARAALDNAEKVLTDIDQRLAKIDAAHSASFGPLIDELRKSIRAAETECA